MNEDVEYLAEEIALSIWNGKIKQELDSKEKEYYFVDLTTLPVEKLPTDKEELKEYLHELKEGIVDVFHMLDDSNRMMGGDGIYKPSKIRVKKGKGESLMIYL